VVVAELEERCVVFGFGTKAKFCERILIDSHSAPSGCLMRSFEVSSEEEMNILTSSKKELLIRRGRSNDGHTSDEEEESGHHFSDDY
jgi:hypothetical protein